MPLNQSETLHRALEQAGVSSRLHVIKGAKHGGPEFADANITQMQRDFLLKTLAVAD